MSLRLPLRTRMALAWGLGSFVLGIVLLVAVAVVFQVSSNTALDVVTGAVVDELGVAPDVPGVEVVAPDGSALPATRLVTIVEDVTDEIRQVATRRLVLLVPGLAVLAGVVGAALAARSVRPLQAMTEVTHRVTSDRLDARIDHLGPDDEIAELADAIDRMMDRLERAFEGQSAFAAAVSHELRTPLAIIRAELDVTLNGPPPDASELAEMAAAVRDALDRSDRTIESLLLLARSGIVDPTDAVAMDELVERATAEVLGGTERDVDVRIEQVDHPVVRGDATLLHRLVRNIVDNAVRHNVEDGWVHVEVGAEDSDATLVVANTGPVLDDEAVARLGEPFYRGVSGRRGVPGTGLGIMVARSIAEGHGGSLGLAARPAGGLRVEVRLPVANT